MEPRQLLSAAAIGPEFQVNTTTAGTQYGSAMAMDADGDFVVIWSSYAQDGSGYGVYAQRYNAAGVAQGGEFRVNTTTASNQLDQTVAMDADGDFVVTWQSDAQDGSSYGVYAQRYQQDGPVQLTANTLAVTGTGLADVISAVGVTPVGGPASLQVIRNGVTYTYDPAKVATITISGGCGNDAYRLDTDVPLGVVSVTDTGGTDTLDFSATTTQALNVNLAKVGVQAVNGKLTLILMAGNVIENVIGGSLGDTLLGNTLANSLTGGGRERHADGRFRERHLSVRHGSRPGKRHDQRRQRNRHARFQCHDHQDNRRQSGEHRRADRDHRQPGADAIRQQFDRERGGRLAE